MQHITTSPDHFGYLKSQDIHVPDARPYGVKTSLLVVPAGQEGRQQYQGPMVPGPWGCTIQHGVVIDNIGSERKERASAQQIMLGEPVTVDSLPGVWCFAERDRHRLHGDGVRLIPHGADPSKVGLYARLEDQPAENLLVTADPETERVRQAAMGAVIKKLTQGLPEVGCGMAWEIWAGSIIDTVLQAQREQTEARS